jgi:hypothetical protein
MSTYSAKQIVAVVVSYMCITQYQARQIESQSMHLLILCSTLTTTGRATVLRSTMHAAVGTVDYEYIHISILITM